MFEALFGADMPLAVRFFLAFLIVLALIGATAWAVRRFGAGRLGSTSLRGRQPRIAVIDYASVDARRRLILVRRDNVEHLLMIGGPTDVVVEPNIVRAVPAARDATLPRPSGGPEALPRAVVSPENGGSWPLQPEPMGSPRSGARVEPHEPMIWPEPQSEAPPRPQRETLAALADEIAARPLPPRSRAGAPELAPEPRVQPPAEPRLSPRAEPRVPPLQPADAEMPMSADQNLAEMAHRLETALRKPKAAPEVRDRRNPGPVVRAVPAPEEAAEAEAAPQPAAAAVSPSRVGRSVDAKPPRADARAGQGKALYDTLEQEMASLLGRPASKT